MSECVMPRRGGGKLVSLMTSTSQWISTDNTSKKITITTGIEGKKHVTLSNNAASTITMSANEFDIQDGGTGTFTTSTSLGDGATFSISNSAGTVTIQVLSSYHPSGCSNNLFNAGVAVTSYYVKCN